MWSSEEQPLRERLEAAGYTGLLAGGVKLRK
jgi:hypothetical protein